MIERLTKTYPCDSCNVEICYRQCYRMSRWAEKAKEKLDEYETAEEAGLLLRLQCKIGAEVWCIYSSLTGEHPIVVSDTFDYGMIPYLGISCFATREEAERAIQKRS